MAMVGFELVEGLAFSLLVVQILDQSWSKRIMKIYRMSLLIKL